MLLRNFLIWAVATESGFTISPDLSPCPQTCLFHFPTTTRGSDWEHHPEGVISVKFADSLVAQKCVEKMRGRWYNGARVIADLWDNVTDYRPPGAFLWVASILTSTYLSL